MCELSARTEPAVVDELSNKCKMDHRGAYGVWVQFLSERRLLCPSMVALSVAIHNRHCKDVLSDGGLAQQSALSPSCCTLG